MEKFKLYHVALYAKGWYKRYNNKTTIWDDLKVMFTLDNYCGDLMSKSDMVNVLLNHCQRLDIRDFKDLTAFATGVDENSCWKYGYYTKGNANWFRTLKEGEELPQYDYAEAIVRYCLSGIVSCETKILCGDGRLPMPNYKDGLPRKNGISNKKLKEMFA